MNDFEVIGLGLVGFGVLFFLLGIFSLSRDFLVTGNLLILIGVSLYMTIQKFLRFLIQKDKIKGSISFILGLILVFVKIPIPGIICELVGSYWLFGGFIPILLSLLSKIPIVSLLIPSSFKAKNDQLM